MKLAYFVVLFSLPLFFSLSHARKVQEDHWKSMMKEQPMPDAIKGLLNEDPAPVSGENHHITPETKKKLFNTNFGTKGTAIIYHKPEERIKGEKAVLNPVHNSGIHHETSSTDGKKTKGSHN